MLKISQVQGVIFDVDETLLDTGRHESIHERSRLQATHEAGARYNLPALLAFTTEQAKQTFLESPIHSLEGAVWQMLRVTGVAASETFNPNDPLLQEIVARKNELYEVMLRSEGKPIAGAVQFVERLHRHGITDMALASTASRNEIAIFLQELTDLKRFFPEARIMSKDNIKHLKPHPEAFDKAFLSLGLPHRARPQVLAFEDNPRGLVSAKSAGLYTCGLTTIYSRSQLAALETPPDLIADSYAEFEALLGLGAA